MSDRKIGMLDQKRSFVSMLMGIVSAGYRRKSVEMPKLETPPVERDHGYRFRRHHTPRVGFGGGTPKRNKLVYEVEDKFLPYGMRENERPLPKRWPFNRKAVLA